MIPFLSVGMSSVLGPVILRQIVSHYTNPFETFIVSYRLKISNYQKLSRGDSFYENDTR